MRKTYENHQIRIFWEPEKCCHSQNCQRALPQVFNPDSRPWIDIDSAEAAEIHRCITNCPSGALTCELLKQ